MGAAFECSELEVVSEVKQSGVLKFWGIDKIRFTFRVSRFTNGPTQAKRRSFGFAQGLGNGLSAR